ncbi:hypothetical protein CYLTODRAFT_397668 [Cylindrobasidium torrendii FP15055 ss-10]|uniref:Uncharacterized protein n=1 Tax=Cylindrobasidium torrendii FP15055 ss-10 TaxID=1314674 RepID=A0A0D7BAL8_9AGAR|nr:hypothetical protein CYLTODRAFT_397668 [Cylindrobasidium torrendii FP15055 ss-10]
MSMDSRDPRSYYNAYLSPPKPHSVEPMSEDIFEQLRDATISPTVAACNNEPSLLLRPATPPLAVPSPTTIPKSPSGRPRSPLPPSGSRSPSHTLSPPSGTTHRRPSTSRQRSSSRLDLIDNERIKTSLQEATDRVQYEVRRAEEAVNRAEYSEHQASQYVATKQALNETESRLRGQELEASSARRQLDILQERLNQMQERCGEMEREREELLDRASRTKRELRDAQLAVRSHEAREQGWEEGVKLGMMKRLNEERQKVWDAGFAEGAKTARASALKEGIKLGRKEGLEEGFEQGRNEERRNAVEAFQVFLAQEMKGTDEWVCSLVMIYKHKPKNLPKLPLSIFTPPTTGTAEKFPVPPSPSKLHPENVVDASITVADGDLALARWKLEAGSVLGDRIASVIVALPDAASVDKLDKSTTVLRTLVPFSLDTEDHVAIPPSSALYTSFTGVSEASIPSLRWALQQGVPVDISVEKQFDDALFESFEDLIFKATADLEKLSPIILSNILPPSDDVSLPIVRLLDHPSYRAYQSRAASLSLIPQLYIKFLPPVWATLEPETPAPDGDAQSDETKEWKRRIKMYLGPIMEAFGFERIIFGTSSTGPGKAICGAGDWYTLARESLAELAVDQEAIDAVFSNTAKTVYG